MTVQVLRHSMTRAELLKWQLFFQWEDGEPDQNDMINQLSQLKNGGPHDNIR